MTNHTNLLKIHPFWIVIEPRHASRLPKKLSREKTFTFEWRSFLISVSAYYCRWNSIDEGMASKCFGNLYPALGPSVELFVYRFIYKCCIFSIYFISRLYDHEQPRWHMNLAKLDIISHLRTMWGNWALDKTAVFCSLWHSLVPQWFSTFLFLNESFENDDGRYFFPGFKKQPGVKKGERRPTWKLPFNSRWLQNKEATNLWTKVFLFSISFMHCTKFCVPIGTLQLLFLASFSSDWLQANNCIQI